MYKTMIKFAAGAVVLLALAFGMFYGFDLWGYHLGGSLTRAAERGAAPANPVELRKQDVRLGVTNGFLKATQNIDKTAEDDPKLALDSLNKATADYNEWIKQLDNGTASSSSAPAAAALPDTSYVWPKAKPGGEVGDLASPDQPEVTDNRIVLPAYQREVTVKTTPGQVLRVKEITGLLKLGPDPFYVGPCGGWNPKQMPEPARTLPSEYQYQNFRIGSLVVVNGTSTTPFCKPGDITAAGNEVTFRINLRTVAHSKPPSGEFTVEYSK